jgi:hypothetical protein
MKKKNTIEFWWERPHGRPRFRWKNNIKMELKETGL